MSVAATILARVRLMRCRAANRRPVCRPKQRCPASLLQAAIELIVLVGLHFFSGLNALPEIRLIEIIQAHPGETHFIYGPLSISDPIFRIRIEPIVYGVVVPGGDV